MSRTVVDLRSETSPLNGIEQISDLVSSDFSSVNALISDSLTSEVRLVRTIGEHIVKSGGKRLRPLIVLLVAKACGYRGTGHVTLATLVEFLHTATLLHDDVVDESSRRRGLATANARWGNSASILVGDFIYSRAFQLMVDLDRMDIMAIISDATNEIAEGEVLQLSNVGNTDVLEATYFEIIRRKTALLFQAACHTAATLATSEDKVIEAMRDFGLHFGLSFQLIDDYLDYAGDSRVMGKNVGDDLSEGKVTLPLIYALRHSTESDSSLIRRSIESRSAEHLGAVIDAVQASGALEYTKEQAQRHTLLATNQLSTLPCNHFTGGIYSLAQTAIERVG